MSAENEIKKSRGWLAENFKWLLCFIAICSFAAAGLIVFSENKQDEIDRKVQEYIATSEQTHMFELVRASQNCEKRISIIKKELEDVQNNEKMGASRAW